MYLVSFDKFHKTAQPTPSYETKKRSRKLPLRNKRNNNNINKKQHPHDKWVVFREKNEETDIKQEAQIKILQNFSENYYPKIYLIRRYLLKMIHRL